MRGIYLRFLVCLCWCWTPRAWSHVSKGELEETIRSQDFVLVAFVSPQEARSEVLQSEWDSAVETAQETLVSFDCAVDMETCNESDVETFPEIHLFQDGKRMTKYKGPGRAAALLHFVARMKRPIISDVTADNLAGFKTADETTFIAWIDPIDAESTKAFGQAAIRYREEFTFGLAGVHAEPPNGMTPPAVKCYKMVDGDSISFTSFEKPDELEHWIKEASRPVIGELTTLNHQRLLDRGWPMVYLFAPTEAERQDIRKRLYKFAKSYYDSLTIVVVNPLDFPELPAKLGLEDPVYPSGAVHQLSKDRVYPYPKGMSITPNALQKWGLDVYQGRVKPWTPPGVTTTYEDLGPTVRATQRVSIAKGWPGVKIKVAGHDEL